MDDQHFDALTRTLAAGAHRRTLAQRLAVLGVVGGVPLLAVPESLAKRRKKKGKKKKKKTTGKPNPTCTPDCTSACGAPDGCGGVCQTGLCGVCRSCVSGSCELSPDGAPCDNGERCTVATCLEGECAQFNPVICNQPANPCRVAECNPNTGACVEKNAPDGDPCVPPCREPSTCSNGVCLPSLETCPIGQECCIGGPSNGVCNGIQGDNCSSGTQCCSGVCGSGNVCV